MARDASGHGHEVPTRREYLTYGGAVIGAGLLAGCTGGSDGGGARNETATESKTNTEAGTEPGTGTTADEAAGETTAGGDGGGSYSVQLAPVGEVTFDAVPKSAFTVLPWYADMATALGHGDSINSMWYAQGFDTIMNYFLSTLDGVSVDWTSLTGEYGVAKERLYELDSDVHFVDPAWVSTLDGWNRADIEEVATNVGPWFANQYSNLHLTPPEPWADRYQYYTLWELFERVARVYREKTRYEALAAVHGDLLSTIEGKLPVERERPTVGYVQIGTDLSSIYVLRLNAPGYYNAHTRPPGATDAFGDINYQGSEFKQVDFEALLAADPDVLLTLWGMTSDVDFEKLRANLENHPVGQRLSAVKNGRVYTQGTRFQGPLMNLFQLEMTAKQLYPEQFGAWPGYRNGASYPDFSGDEQLFDRQRVRDIIAGDV